MFGMSDRGDLGQLLEAAVHARMALVIMAEGVDKEVLAAYVFPKLYGQLSVAIVEAPRFSIHLW
jgi:hypothetical protein